jgi:hypothetical protein
MGVSESVLTEFKQLHESYKEAHEKILVLQATAIEGIRKIGVGCITEESRTEFISLEKEINRTLSRMREICESLHKGA